MQGGCRDHAGAACFILYLAHPIVPCEQKVPKWGNADLRNHPPRIARVTRRACIATRAAVRVACVPQDGERTGQGSTGAPLGCAKYSGWALLPAPTQRQVTAGRDRGGSALPEGVQTPLAH